MGIFKINLFSHKETSFHHMRVSTNTMLKYIVMQYPCIQLTFNSSTQHQGHNRKDENRRDRCLPIGEESADLTH